MINDIYLIILNCHLYKKRVYIFYTYFFYLLQFFFCDSCSKSDIAIFVREVFKKFFFPALLEGSDFFLSHRQTFIDQYSLRIFKLSQVFFLR